MAENKEEYRTAYKDSGKPICPECGYDFTGEKGSQVIAHIEGVHPGFNAQIDSETAQARFDVLKAIAKELG